MGSIGTLHVRGRDGTVGTLDRRAFEDGSDGVLVKILFGMTGGHGSRRSGDRRLRSDRDFEIADCDGPNHWGPFSTIGEFRDCRNWDKWESDSCALVRSSGSPQLEKYMVHPSGEENGN